MGNIVAPPSASRDVVLANLGDVHARFRDPMFDLLWHIGLDYELDPVGMIAQAGKETRWGHYPGRVKPWFYNTAGIKVRHVSEAMVLLGTSDGDHPLVHQQFPNWEVGVTAHAQHLRAYAGVPVEGQIVDPRYSLVSPGVTTWADLGGRWAPSPTYGTELEAIMQRLSGAA